MSLSSLIVQREVATMRQVEEALARQVIYGGDLVTNLLEVARVDEGILTELLAESMGLPPAPAGELLRAPDSVRALLPLELAFERSMVPLELRGEALVLAAAAALPTDVREQLEFALGVRIELCAAPAVRVWQAISAGYGAPMERRMQRLVGRLAGDPGSAGASLPPLLDATPSVPPVAPRAVSRPGSAPPPRHKTPLPGIVPGAGAGGLRGPGRRSTLTSFPATGGSGRAVQRAPSIVPSGPPATADASVIPVQPSSPQAGPLLESRSGLLQGVVAPVARAGRRRRGPLTFEQARQDADEALDRDTLLALFFDFSRQFFEYAALFLVQGDIAEGRDGFGSGAHRERVLGIGLPLDLPSLLSRARETRVAVLSTAPAEGLDASLLNDLHRPHDVEVAVVPLVVRTRSVALLVGDCGDLGIDRDAIRQVTAFGEVVSKAFERIIVRRKLEGFVAGSRASGPGSVEGPGGAGPVPTAATSVPSPPSPPSPLVPLRDFRAPPIPREEPDWPPNRPANGQVVRESALEPDKALLAAVKAHVADETPEAPAAVEPDGITALAVCVPPHRPPSARVAAAEPLPSVIVDIERELSVIVERLLGGEADEQAELELLRQGERAVRVLMKSFPGPVTLERARIAAMTNPPRASECGPLLRLLARQRRIALPFVLERVGDPDAEVSGWATHLLGELAYSDALPALVARLCDADASTRRSAALAIGVISRSLPDLVVDSLSRLTQSPHARERAAATRAMGEVREAALASVLVRVLAEDQDEAVVASAHEALVLVTRQDFGTDPAPWQRWLAQSGGRHRLEWLIDALTHEVAEVRRVAGEELRALSRQYFGYASDLPSRERERAQQRYRDWWITEGRTRHRRL